MLDYPWYPCEGIAGPSLCGLSSCKIQKLLCESDLSTNVFLSIIKMRMKSLYQLYPDRHVQSVNWACDCRLYTSISHVSPKAPPSPFRYIAPLPELTTFCKRFLYLAATGRSQVLFFSGFFFFLSLDELRSEKPIELFLNAVLWFNDSRPV